MAEFSRRGFLTVMGAAGVGGAVGLPAEAQGVRRPAGPDFDLFRLAYGFEQATKAKRTPVSTPPLDGR
jgi:hypothetical protein